MLLPSATTLLHLDAHFLYLIIQYLNSSTGGAPIRAPISSMLVTLLLSGVIVQLHYRRQLTYRRRRDHQVVPIKPLTLLHNPIPICLRPHLQLIQSHLRLQMSPPKPLAALCIAMGALARLLSLLVLLVPRSRHDLVSAH